MVTASELRQLVADGVADGLERQRAAPSEGLLLDRNELALAFDCSAGLVDKLRRQGMPCLYLGDSPRFERAACLAWLRASKAAP